MKILLKKIISKRLWEKLANTKNALKRKAYFLFETAGASFITMLPDRFLIFLKANAVMRKKMDYKKKDIFLDIESKIEYDVRLHSCKKEPEMIGWIHSFINHGEVLYDIGANVGAYSLVASKHLNGKIKVYAFEPGFITFVQLCKNIYLNNCQESIFPLQIALSDKTNIEIFNYNNLIPGGALHALGDAVDDKGDQFNPVFKQLVISFRLDDLIKLFYLPVPNHIKIDVDGIEFKILQGATETLKNCSVRSLILEAEDGTKELKKIIEYLKQKGFDLHSKHKHTETMGNYIFKRVVANAC
jgi:FkbM family methyltransferase